jgi:hypothetical protein
VASAGGRREARLRHGQTTESGHTEREGEVRIMARSTRLVTERACGDEETSGRDHQLGLFKARRGTIRVRLVVMTERDEIGRPLNKFVWFRIKD